MSRSDRSLSPATRAAQALGMIDPRTGAVVPGIEPATTFARDAEYGARQAYIYARDGGPTVEQAEAVLASLDGAARSLVFASGMAAFVALCETLRAGERVAAPRVMYHGGLVWLRRIAERRGLGLDLFDASADGALEAAVRPGTRLLWVETPTNPTWDVVDVAAASRAAKAMSALLAVDCTVAPPCTMRALALGADIAFHSGTKYLGGHSDLTAGVLSLRDPALADEIRAVRTLMGSVLQPFEAWLLIRGMRTLFLRYERASANAMRIAEALLEHPKASARDRGAGFGGAAEPAAAVGGDRSIRLSTPPSDVAGTKTRVPQATRRAASNPPRTISDSMPPNPPVICAAATAWRGCAGSPG